MKPIKNQRGMLDILLIVILAVLVAVGGYVYYHNHHKKIVATPVATPAATPVKAAAIDPTASWSTYTNQDLKLSFKYPPAYGDFIVTFTPGSTGTSAAGKFSKNTNLSFGADNDAFTAGRSGGFFDTLGFVKLSPTSYEFKLGGGNRIVLDGVFKDLKGVNTSGILVKPVIDPTTSGYEFYQFQANSLGAVFNLSGTVYPGVSFLDTDSSKLSQSDFEQILATVKAL